MVVGKCRCGVVRYAVEGPFRYAGYCHCSRCRARTGSAFSAFAGIEKDQLRVTDGEDSITTYEMNPDNIVSFCQHCGSSPFSLVRDGEFWHVAMGTLVDDPGIRPMCHIFVGSKAPWHEITDSLPQYAELPAPGAWRPEAPALAPAAWHEPNGGRHGTADDQNR
jgi:hypothetical protein